MHKMYRRPTFILCLFKDEVSIVRLAQKISEQTNT